MFAGPAEELNKGMAHERLLNTVAQQPISGVVTYGVHREQECGTNLPRLKLSPVGEDATARLQCIPDVLL